MHYAALDLRCRTRVVRLFDHGRRRGRAIFDCGTNTTTCVTPTQWLRDNGRYGQVDHLVISHFDADHVADAHNLVGSLGVRTLWRNKGQSSARVRAHKDGYSGMDAGLEAALDLHEAYTYPGTPLSFPMPTYWNNTTSFDDQNNLSLVAIPQIDGMTPVFPDDLESDGWDALLRNSKFRQGALIARHSATTRTSAASPL